MPDRRPVIFLAFANDQVSEARYLRGLGRELREIRQALGPARQAKAVEIVERANATLSDILDVFQDPEYSGRIRAFHYGGHAETYRLLLESDQGAPEVAHAAGLARFFANQDGLQLVFLNGCSTREQALELRAQGVPAVIATSEEINDEVAQRFAARFYKGIGGYATVEKSYGDAQAELLTLQGTGDRSGLYFEAATDTQRYPWEVFPDPPPVWQLSGKAAPKVSKLPLRDLKIGKYAHVLCDRYTQHDEFVSRNLASPAQKPKVFIIHGHRDEKHESLITRFSYQYIGQKDQYLRPVEIPNWPFKGEVETLLRVRLATHFEGLEWGDRSVSELTASHLLEEAARLGREALILQHNIPAEYWNQETADLLRWYIGEFWHMEEPPPGAPQTVVFINVLYSDEVKKAGFLSKLFSRSYYKEKIIKELETITQANDPNCTLLSELGAVRRPHVADWLIETNLAELDELADLPERIFRAGERMVEALAMAQIERHLKSAVEQLQKKYAQLEM